MLEMFNPDKGHVYRRFYKAKKENTLKNGNIFIPALPSDNPDPAVQIWVQNQIENASSQTVERLVYGNFEYDENNDCLIERDAMFDYFKNEHVGLKGNHYLTCDIARMGNDSTVVRVWHGYVCIDVVSWYQCGLDVTAQRIKEIAIKYSIGMSRVLVDENGIGGGVVDILRCKGFLNNGKAKKGNYSNLKTECSHIIAKLINERKLYEYQSSINQRVIIEELEQCRILNVDSEGKISLIKKDKMKESLRRSPDHLDTIIMRGYFEIFKSSV
jgi:hypothetical protein